MEQRHTLLNRQLKKYFGNTENIPKELGTFIAAVNDAYCGFDSDRELLERSIDISSRELTQSVSLLSAALESTDDGILVVDLNGRVVGYNSKFIKMWNIPEDVVATKDDNKLLGCVMANLIDAESFLTKVRHLYSHPDEQSFDTIKFKDGRIIERFSAPQKIGGSTVGRVWSFRDVTIRKKAEDELKASKQMLQLVMDNIQQAIFWKDRNFAYLGCNIVFAKAAGLKKPEDVIGKTDYDLPWKKEESDFFRQCDKEIMESNKARAHILEPIQMANGKQAWIDVNKVPLHDIDGNVFGIIGTYEDVTERRRAESSLRESEERFKQITANAAEWIWEIDAKGLITYSSPVVEQLFGYKPEEIVGKKYIYDLFLSPKRKQLKEMVFRFIAAKQSFRGFVNPNLHKNGRIVWVATNGMPMLDSKGNLIGYRGSNIDITPQKQANEEIKKSHAILQQMINSMPFAVMVIGKDKVIRQANAAALHITGYKEEELIGHKCNKTLCPALENECPILDKGQTLDRSEKNAITKDQKTVPILKSAISIRLGEEDVLLEAFFDISQRRWVEEEMKKLNVQLEHTIEKLEITNCELSNFVNMASHDLREPLRKVSAFGMLLQQSLGNKVSADEAENLGFMIEGSRAMTKMVEGLLAYSHINSSEQLLEKTDLNMLIEQMRNFELAEHIAQKHLEIQIPATLPDIMADSTQIRQLIMHLIDNSIKFQRNGNTPYITITSKPAPDGMVRIEISDNGIGIEPEYQQAVFLMFKRLNDKSKFEGTGIGLALCKKIVEKHGGKIGVESQPGEGSTFWFAVPIAQKSVAAEAENMNEIVDEKVL